MLADKDQVKKAAQVDKLEIEVRKQREIDLYIFYLIELFYCMSSKKVVKQMDHKLIIILANQQ